MNEGEQVGAMVLAEANFARFAWWEFSSGEALLPKGEKVGAIALAEAVVARFAW